MALNAILINPKERSITEIYYDPRTEFPDNILGRSCHISHVFHTEDAIYTSCSSTNHEDYFLIKGSGKCFRGNSLVVGFEKDEGGFGADNVILKLEYFLKVVSFITPSEAVFFEKLNALA